MTVVLLARHGQSTWNADGRWQGQADPPLSAVGQQQATAAALHVGPVDAIWTSPLVRAHRTAELIARSAAGPVEAGEVAVDERLQERDAGEWTGLTRDEIQASWPGFLASRRRPPGFEPDDELLGRALDALHHVASSAPGGRVLAVSHGGLIRVVERGLGGESPPVPNLAGREVIAGEGGLVLGPRFLLLDPEDDKVTTPRQI